MAGLLDLVPPGVAETLTALDFIALAVAATTSRGQRQQMKQEWESLTGRVLTPSEYGELMRRN